MEALILLLVFGLAILVGRAFLHRRRGDSSGATGGTDEGDAAYYGSTGYGGGPGRDDSRDDGGGDFGHAGGFGGDGGFGGGDAGGGDGGGGGGD